MISTEPGSEMCLDLQWPIWSLSETLLSIAKAWIWVTFGFLIERFWDFSSSYPETIPLISSPSFHWHQIKSLKAVTMETYTTDTEKQFTQCSFPPAILGCVAGHQCLTLAFTRVNLKVSRQNRVQGSRKVLFPFSLEELPPCSDHPSSTPLAFFLAFNALFSPPFQLL